MHSHKTNIRLKIMHKLFELFRKDNKTSNPPPFFWENGEREAI